MNKLVSRQRSSMQTSNGKMPSDISTSLVLQAKSLVGHRQTDFCQFFNKDSTSQRLLIEARLLF